MSSIKPKSKQSPITIFSEDNEGWYRPIGHADQSKKEETSP